MLDVKKNKAKKTTIQSSMVFTCLQRNAAYAVTNQRGQQFIISGTS